jgi:RimJ/RimL family protein N-acetyltransferase
MEQGQDQTPKAEIVQLTSDNWQLLKDMRLKALQTDPLAFGRTYEEESQLSDEDWKDKLTDPDSEWFFSKKDGKYIAMAGVIFAKRKIIQHRAEINGVFVEPAYRRQGIGEDLVRCILAKLKANSKTAKVELNVRAPQESAIKMYEKLGFRTIGVHKKNAKIDGIYYDMISMELIFEDKL